VKFHHAAVSLVLLLGAGDVAAQRFEDYDDERAYATCEIYERRHELAARQLKDLEREEIQPMRQRRTRLEREIRHRTRRPDELERKASGLSRDVAKIESNVRATEGKIDSLMREADALERAGNTKKAANVRKQAFKQERKNAERLAQIEQRQGRIDALRQESSEIRAAEPPLSELQSALAELDRELADVDGIRRRKSGQVRFLRRTLDMCRDYRELQRTCER
jgi:DNA repair ATPase RecN